MPRKTAFLYTDEFLSYRLGDKHPLQQRRLQMVHRLLDAYGAFSPGGPVDDLTPTPAPDEALAAVHTPGYLDAVRRAGRGEARAGELQRYGLGPGDTPAFPGIYESAALYAGGSRDAANLLIAGDYEIAFNVAGGLHHAHPDRASGFCTFNDLALAANAFLAAGYARVAYVDIDVHHGDGVQACFWDDPRVLTVSLHESGRFLFPGTGEAEEVGGPDAQGTALNVPFFPYTRDDVWHEAFDAAVLPVLTRFRPEALVLQLGADAHWDDPLAHLQLSSRGWMEAVRKLLDFGREMPIVVTGGGGYNLKTVARLWTMVQAECAGLSLPDAVPATFAQEYGISHLHDTSAPPPSAGDEAQKDAKEFARAQVALLRGLHGF